jgi:polyphosphate glucokinase
MANVILGIDIGGTGIKGALVDCKTGTLTAERFKIATPQPATPESVSVVVKQIATHFNYKGHVGITFPGVVKEGIICSAANVDKSWIGLDASAIFSKKLKSSVTVLNDADAAGVAEMQFGAGKGYEGIVIMITLGTGIGSALFYNGELLPNSEFGHIEIRGKDAEVRASGRAKEIKELSWEKWSKNVAEFLGRLEFLMPPNLFIIGGGISKKADKFFPLLEKTVKTPIVAAKMLNDSGIIGAAFLAKK